MGKEKMRQTFEKFPEEATCPICGKNTDKECALVPIYGTGDGRIIASQPVHVECLLNGVMYYRDYDAIAANAPHGEK